MKRQLVFVLLASLSVFNSLNAQINASVESIRFYSSEWTGDSFPDGRPRVEDQYLERLIKLSIEEVWGILREHGYDCQFDSGWEMVHPSKPFVGRAVTALYLPSRPDVHNLIEQKGHSEGHIGRPNAWPIDVLENGDVYVADAGGKIIDGTLIGDNLGNAIYSKSRTGAVFNAGARDPEGLESIEGFNAYVRGFDPSYLVNLTMMGINVPIRIGRAVVFPGDVVLAKKGGVLFVPPHMVREAVLVGEFVQMMDKFGHQAIRTGLFTTGQIDSEWTEEIKEVFIEWLENNPDESTMSRKEFDEMFNRTHW
jgi:4-hydroxy-4-methyl-2-oxoglutarate aldolase